MQIISRQKGLNIVQVDGVTIEKTQEGSIKVDNELEELLKEAKMTITIEDILNTPTIMENMKGLIPILTENDVIRTEANGIVTYNDNTGATSENTGVAEGYYLEYEFPQEVYAMQIKYIFTNGSSYEGTRVIVIQAYDMETEKWEDLTEEYIYDDGGLYNPEVTININYNNTYKKYRLYVVNASGSMVFSGVQEMQYYGKIAR